MIVCERAQVSYVLNGLCGLLIGISTLPVDSIFSKSFGVLVIIVEHMFEDIVNFLFLFAFFLGSFILAFIALA